MTLTREAVEEAMEAYDAYMRDGKKRIFPVALHHPQQQKFYASSSKPSLITLPRTRVTDTPISKTTVMII